MVSTGSTNDEGRPGGTASVWISMLLGGRYWVRTSDLFGVNEARYHCANRPLRTA